MSDETKAAIATPLATSTLATPTEQPLATLYRPSAMASRRIATSTASASASASASATATAGLSSTVKSSINWFVLLIILIPALFIVYSLTKRILACFARRKPAPVAPVAQTTTMPVTMPWAAYAGMHPQQPPAAMMTSHLSPMQQMQYLAHQQHAPTYPAFEPGLHRAYSWDDRPMQSAGGLAQSWEKPSRNGY